MVVLSIQVCIGLKVVKKGVYTLLSNALLLRRFSSGYGAVNSRAHVAFCCQKPPTMLSTKVID